MSTIIFTSESGEDQAGQLIAIRSGKKGAPTPGLLSLAGITDAQVLVTSFNMAAQVAQQSLPTIGGPEYIYVFGDVLQDITIGIVLYAKSCTEDSGSFLTAWNFYTDKRIKPGSVKPVTLTFGGLTITGLVVGFHASADAGAGSSIINGNLMLKGWVPTENVTPNHTRRGL